ncbi:hypothetical protein BOTBODRAFT_32985 [Botryobasidium botryosum FD-172 SS1]|uniref:Uncharacterized protein n=1 Tax=Botryobasidium botryosum (strain FD-172 SS1) TaxID=930990 RepID=A0A067MRH5_BOTB1|nr:hypothetical protein BOTBODRAFT_32985 [Botryobasidium botryosum FD-172 SS1]
MASLEKITEQLANMVDIGSKHVKLVPVDEDPLCQLYEKIIEDAHRSRAAKRNEEKWKCLEASLRSDAQEWEARYHQERRAREAAESQLASLRAHMVRVRHVVFGSPISDLPSSGSFMSDWGSSTAAGDASSQLTPLSKRIAAVASSISPAQSNKGRPSEQSSRDEPSKKRPRVGLCFHSYEGNNANILHSCARPTLRLRQDNRKVKAWLRAVRIFILQLRLPIVIL